MNKAKKTPITKKLVKEIKPKIATTKVKLFAHTNKNIKISPRKLRILANTVKKLKPLVALTRLKLSNSKSARVLYKNIQNAVANLKNDPKANIKTASFHSIQVDESIKFKRMDKSHSSRFARGLIQKRHSRLKIIISATIGN